MTPAEHITEAERLLQYGPLSADWASGEINQVTATKALAHALIAVAVELGAPHPAAPGGGETGAPQAPPG